jgi:hypothetical protein
MKDITNETDQYTRGMLALMSPDGMFKDGNLDGVCFRRKYQDDSIKVGEETYVRNGTILWNDDPNAGEDIYYIVYQLRTKQ